MRLFNMTPRLSFLDPRNLCLRQSNLSADGRNRPFIHADQTDHLFGNLGVAVLFPMVTWRVASAFLVHVYGIVIIGAWKKMRWVDPMTHIASVTYQQTLRDLNIAVVVLLVLWLLFSVLGLGGGHLGAVRIG
jgi:hypothetical protein